MAGIMATRGPRTYAGDKAAPLDEFFLSMAHSLARGDRSKQESITRTCERIQKELCVRNVFDIGSLMRFPRQKMLDLLGSVDKDLEHWVDSLEDVLEFEFRTLTAVETFRAHVPGAPPPSAELVPKPSSYRVAAYTHGRLSSLGAKLEVEGLLGTVVFSYSMFVKLVTQNPKVETLTEPEVAHIADTVWEMTFEKYGEVHVDQIYRKHCGQKLRLLFPHLPDRGKVKGDERKFEDILKWRFNNPRKAPVKGKAPYKPDFKIDRINLCEAAIELIDDKNFPLTVVNEGKLETKFMPPQAFSDEQPMPEGKDIQYFGAPPPPPPAAAGGAWAMPSAQSTPWAMPPWAVLPQGWPPVDSAATAASADQMPLRLSNGNPLAPVTASSANSTAATNGRRVSESTAATNDPENAPPSAAIKRMNPNSQEQIKPVKKAKAAAAPAAPLTEPVRHRYAIADCQLSTYAD